MSFIWRAHMSKHLIDLPAAERDEFSFRPLVSKHRIHDLNLVGDDELIALLDTYPRERLQAFTMGTDRGRGDDAPHADGSAASAAGDSPGGSAPGSPWIRRRPPGGRSSRRGCAAGSG